MAPNSKSSNTKSHYDNEELLFSRTERNGVILSANSVFARASQYPLKEVLRRPHSLVRHSDMPRVIFKLMWDEILAGRSMTAYLKNRASDGSSYWVLSNIYSQEQDFVSIHLKPTSTWIGEWIEPLYRKLRGMEDSTTLEQQVSLLFQTLKDRGYTSYADFMRAALRCEVSLIASDILQLETPTNEVCKMWQQIQDSMSQVLKSTDSASEEIHKLTQVFEALSRTTRAQDLLPFNLTLSTQKSHLTQKTMEVLARLFAQQQSEAKAFLEEFRRVITAAEVEGLAPIRYQLGACFLQASALRQFGVEIFSDQIHSQFLMSREDLIRESVALIQGMLRQFEISLKSINELRSRFIRIMTKREEMETLTKSVLSIAQLGLVEISHDVSAQKSALPHLTQMRKMAEELNQRIVEMGSGLQKASSGLDQSTQVLIKSNRRCVQAILKLQNQEAKSRAA